MSLEAFLDELDEAKAHCQRYVDALERARAELRKQGTTNDGRRSAHELISHSLTRAAESGMWLAGVATPIADEVNAARDAK